MPIRMTALVALIAAGPAFAQRTPAPADAEAYIIEPEDGATVTNPVTIVFGLRGLGIAPAGVEKENTGHHHLLINVSPDSIDYENALPADDVHVHFGGGQTETTQELPVGAHRIQLLLGDLNHVPHEPPVLSEPITITVE